MAPSAADELTTAIEAVRLASRLCRNVQAGITPEALEKKDRSPVTVADFASQAVICRMIEEAFPGDAVLAEEDAGALREGENRPFLEQIAREMERVDAGAGDFETICRWIDRGNAEGGSGRFWTLDPIDGTKGFLRGEQYAVSLALIVDGRIEVGALGCPNLRAKVGRDEPRGVILVARRGDGARALPLDGAGPGEPIGVSDTADPAEARFCESVESGHSSHGWSARVAERLGITRPPVRLDSQAKYAAVARGEADIYMRLPTRPGYVEKIWDHAGGVLVVEEAGGRVSDIEGRPLEFDRGSGLTGNRGVLVSNGRLHEQVLEALSHTETTS